jgi:hypothetical protein
VFQKGSDNSFTAYLKLNIYVSKFLNSGHFNSLIHIIIIRSVCSSKITQISQLRSMKQRLRPAKL